MRSTGPARLLGLSDHAVWIGVDDEVIVLSDKETVRLPNTVELAVDHLGRWVSNDDAVVVGGGIITVGLLTVSPRRWFDPQPILSKCSSVQLAKNVTTLVDHAGAPTDTCLGEALAGEDVEAVLSAVRLLLGKGQGLTPEGDDVVAGALASYVLLGRSIGVNSTLLEGVTQPLEELSRTQTNSFSGALLRHALQGRVARPFSDVLHALTGRGDIASTTDRLLAVGHSSGPALAAGLRVGSSAIISKDVQ